MAFLKALLGRKPRLPAAAVPPGRRVYAIGDVHGRLDLLDQMLATIEADDRARDPAETVLVFLGDFIDRGPHSCGVIARLIALRDAATGDGSWRPGALFLMGNHEELLLDMLDGDRVKANGFIRIGGRATLESYGVPGDAIDGASIDGLGELLADYMPAEHVAFVRGLDDRISIGDYLFVHAGIRPGVALDRQKQSDLRWIRGEFLRHEGDHGVTVVHGHSISETVACRPNRIGLDTGAYVTGRLSAVCLEGEERRYFQAELADGAA